MTTRHDRSLTRTGTWLLLTHALLGCSLIVDNELDGRHFGGHEDAGSAGSGGRGGSGGSGGGGSSGSGADEDAGGVDDGGGAAGGSGEGGSGGSDAATDDGGTDAGPTATLSVVSTDPDDGDSTTYVYGDVVIVLSHDVEEVADSRLKVIHRESGKAVSGSVATDGDTVTFSPDDPIIEAGHYDVTLDHRVATADGVELGDDYELTFSIVAGFPGDAEYIDRTDTPGSSEADVGVDAEGNAIVIWLQRGAGGSLVYSSPWFARYTQGEGWSKPKALDSASGAAYSPKVAVAHDGSAIATWTHDPNSGSMPTHVMAAHYEPSAGWSTPVALDDDPDHDPASQYVAAAVDGAGNGVVAWSRGASTSAMGQGDFFIARYDAAGASFGSPIALVTSSTSAVSGSGRIEAALPSDGLALVAGTLGFSGHAVFKQPASAGGDWTQVASKYDSDGVAGEGTGLALDDSEVVYAGFDYDWGDVEVARVGTTFQSRDAARFSEMLDPHVALSGSADVVGTWIMRGPTSATRSIWAITYDHVEADWALSATDVFPDRGALDIPGPPDVAAYLDTGALITWAANGELYAVDRGGGDYGDPNALERVEEAAQPWVRLAANSQGMGVVVWHESDGVNPQHVAAQTFRGSP